MKFNLVRLLSVFILFALIIYSCTSEDNSVNPPSANSLINTSFEKNGYFSTDGWILPAQSDSSKDVPANGGNYSLLLKASWFPELYAEIKVPVLSEYNNYKLSFWSKSSGVTSGVFGRGILSLLRNGSTIKSKSITVNVNNWRSYTIIDTFDVAEGDSFLVQLTAGISQLLPGDTNFDLCTLEAIE
jgi:hypothetical protein